MALGLNKVKIGRKIGLYIVICGMLGAAQFFMPVSLILSTLQSRIAAKPVSGDIVVVGIDSDSIRDVGRWPWPREKQAELLRAIDKANPKAVYIDLDYKGVTNPYADEALRLTLEKMKSPVTVAALATENKNGKVKTIFSHPNAIGNTESASVILHYLLGYVWSLPYRVETSRGSIKSFSASIAGINDHSIAKYRLDLSFDPQSIKILSANDVIRNTSSVKHLAGKKVVVGITGLDQNDIHSMPGWGEHPGVLFHIIGAESIANETPGAIGFYWFFGFAALLCITLLTASALRFSSWILLIGGIVTLATSTVLTIFNIGNDPLPAIGLLLCTGIHVKRQKIALLRSQRNAETGYSSMDGYFIEEVVSNAIFIAASFRIADTKRGISQTETNPVVMKEIGRRLSAIIDERQLTHNLEGQFLWESPAMATPLLAGHLEGLKHLFALPLLIDGRNVDIDIFFGVDRDVNSNIAIRSKRALKASREAMTDQSTFKIATTLALENQLQNRFCDEFEVAANNGDIAVVFQAQKSLTTNIITSAEVCLNWTHPAHGQIPTTMIVNMARKSENIELISLLLCKKALEYSKKFKAHGANYRLSAKISAAALQSDDFHVRLLEMTKNKDCDAKNITLQIVDPQVAAADPKILSKIRMLKSEGFSIAIGNFGQTNDDIDLLKAIKPNEIVLARTFSKELFGSTSNRIYVDAALRIARAHNIVTIAEDVEDRDILDELKSRGCDKAQGKIVGIPLHFNDFLAGHINQLQDKTG